MLDLMLARSDMANLARPSHRYCAEHGLNWELTAQATGGLFLAPIRPLGVRSFEFDKRGDEAPVIEALDEHGDVVDLVTWFDSDSLRVRTLFDRCAVLGAFGATDPLQFFFNQPLRIHADPLSWLRAHCEGVVVIDRGRAARWLLDVPCSRIAVDDETQAADLLAAKQALFSRQQLVIPT